MITRGMLGRDHPSRGRLLPQTAGAGRVASSRPALLSSMRSVEDAGSNPVAGSPRSTVAFVFQGGGSLAACQVGMVRALTERGVVADLVVGSSAGALNAVAFASGARSDHASLVSLWSALQRRHVAPFSARTIVRAFTGHADGIFSNVALRLFVQDHFPRRLEDTDIPAHVVVTDMSSGAPVVISSGMTAPALLASSAFPGLYPPVAIAGRRYIDGGVSADVPVLQAEQLGATVTYVLPAAVSEDRDAPMRGPMALAYRALGQILDAAARRDISMAHGSVRILPAPMSNASNPIDFRNTARLIQDGYQLATPLLDGDAETSLSSAAQVASLVASHS